MKETSLCDFRGRSILVGLKKKKILPTDPNFEDHAIGNTQIFFLALYWWSKPEYPEKTTNLLQVTDYHAITTTMAPLDIESY